KLRAGVLLPWTSAPYGYRLDPDRPRDPRGVTLDPGEAATVAELFALYREPGASLMRRRQLVLLLVDRVIVTDADVEIRYVLPTSPESEHVRFCHCPLPGTETLAFRRSEG